MKIKIIHDITQYVHVILKCACFCKIQKGDGSVGGCDGMQSVKGSVSHYLPAAGQEFTVNSFNTENCTADTNNTRRGRG